MPVHKINFFLDVLSQTADHQRLFGYVNTLAAMQHVFGKITSPRLASHCALGGLSNGTLTIFAKNGAIAARLRQHDDGGSRPRPRHTSPIALRSPKDDSTHDSAVAV